MTEVSKDTGIATAVLSEFTEHRLPKAQALKAKVDRGETKPWMNSTSPFSRTCLKPGNR